MIGLYAMSRKDKFIARMQISEAEVGKSNVNCKQVQDNFLVIEIF
jgi:hypothetical protein